MLNSRDIDLLRPDVAENCRRWMARCRDAGLAVLVTNTVRDEEYQAWLYAQGRTRPGGIVTNGKVPTFHSVEAGLAFEFVEAPDDTSVHPNTVDIDMTFTAPTCPAADFILEDVRQKVDALDGVKSATVNLVFEPVWDQSMLSEEARLELGLE